MILASGEYYDSGLSGVGGGHEGFLWPDSIKPKEVKFVVEHFPAAPIMYKHLQELQSQSGIKPDLDEIPRYYESESSRASAIREAENLWRFVYDKDKLAQCLQGKQSQEKYKYLKSVRRAGLVLRNMYTYFSKDHTCPKDFKKFITTLGAYNDKYKKGGGKKNLARLLELQNTMSIGDVEKIERASDGEFYPYIQAKFDSIQKSLSQSELPEEEFHTTRKDIRSLADVVLLPASESSQKGVEWVLAGLIDISTSMGKARTKHGSKKEDVVLEVKFKNREKFKEVLPFVQRILAMPQQRAARM